jgi:hypothetical protein
MEKIDLFLILAFKEQTRKYLDLNRRLLERERRGLKEHVSTMARHIHVLSKLFNLHNFFEETDQITRSPNPMIYHIPYGLDNLETGVEGELLKWKGKVPIVARVYDPHSPIKNCAEYMSAHHDLILSYNETHLGLTGFQFRYLSYDNHLVGVEQTNRRRRKLCCMILGNKYSGEEPLVGGFEVFSHTHLGMTNNYNERDKIGSIQQVDVYGSGWDPRMPNYKGTLNPFDRKYETARRYRFSVALENCMGRTYLSEKILDCFLTLTVPVYLGAPNVTDHIPKDCFIDVRDFGSYADLFSHLESLSETEYREYVENIRAKRMAMFDKFSTAKNIVQPIYDWHGRNVRSMAFDVESEAEAMSRDLEKLRLTRNKGVYKEKLISALRQFKRRVYPRI